MKQTYTLTTIEVQGQQESVYEIYADKSREQTIAYALEESTARLIAAAPELLEALDELAAFLERLAPQVESNGLVGTAGNCTRRAQFARAAIAKARGEV